MGNLLLFEHEELVRRFRPHMAAYLPRYALACWWAAAGAALVWVLRVVEPLQTLTVWGGLALGCIGLGLGVAVGRRGKRRIGFPLLVVALGAAACWLATWGPLAGSPYVTEWGAASVGAGASLLALVVAEWDRRAREHLLTTERLVVREGLGRRREHTVGLGAIQGVRSQRGLLGQVFDYGDVTLVLHRSSRPDKEGNVAERTEVLHGVAHVQEVKHQVEATVAAHHLPRHDRKRATEDRRLRDSMRAVADWMRHEAPRA